LLTETTATAFRPEVHFLQFTGICIPSREGTHTGSAYDNAPIRTNKICCARYTVRAEHVIDLGIVNSEPLTSGTKLRHYRTDNICDLLVVGLLDGSYFNTHFARVSILDMVFLKRSAISSSRPCRCSCTTH